MLRIIRRFTLFVSEKELSTPIGVLNFIDVVYVGEILLNHYLFPVDDVDATCGLAYATAQEVVDDGLLSVVDDELNRGVTSLFVQCGKSALSVRICSV